MNMIYCGELIDDNRMRVIISNDQEQELATLYFERAKLKFTNVPVGMNLCACVDSTTEGLYDYDPDTTPKEIVKNSQDLIKEFPTGGGMTIPQRENITDDE